MPQYNIAFNMNKAILQLFSGQDKMITIPKLYVELTGDHLTALVLSQIVFWSNKSRLKDSWFYKDYQDWKDETLIPERTLRRRLSELEKKGWIETKVKKIYGVNTKHARPVFQNIIASIAHMLDPTFPERPDCPLGSSSIQKYTVESLSNCTIHIPYGHNCKQPNSTTMGQEGLSEKPDLADHTIYTDEDNKTTKLQNPSSSFSQSTFCNNQTLGTTNADLPLSPTDPSTKSDYQNNQTLNVPFLSKLGHNKNSRDFSFSQSLDEKILQQKLPSDKRTDDEFLQVCVDHVDNHSDKKYPRLRRAGGLVKLLEKLRADNVFFNLKGDIVANSVPTTHKAPSPFTQEELDLVAEYKSAVKYHSVAPERLDAMMPDKARQIQAREILRRIEDMHDKEDENRCQPRMNARRFSLNSASSLVSHLGL